MKKLLLLLLFLPFISLAQQYSEVVEVPGKKADQLYTKANEWFALTFKSANDVIQLKDPIERKIIGKGIKQVGYFIRKYPVTLDVYFTLLVQFKDEKYKYDLQTSEIKTADNHTYTFERFKEMATVEGQTEYLKSIGASPWVIGKKQIQISADGNKMAVAEIETQLKAIIDDLTLTLKKEDDKANW